MGPRVVRSPEIALFLFVIAIFGLRMATAARMPLSPDEAYYWRWSLLPALSYADHPPLVAWMIRLGVALFGPTALGVRFCAILLGAVAVPVTVRLARNVGLRRGDAALGAALSTLIVAPASAALIITPDTPLGLCWLVAVLALERLLARPSTVWWLALGAAFGVALTAKHSALLIPLLVLVSAIRPSPLRRSLRTTAPWLALLLALLIASPYLIAEVRSGLPSVRLQAAHLLGRLGASTGGGLLRFPERLGGLLAGQLGLLTPVVLGWAVWGCRALRKPQAFNATILGFLLPLAVTAVITLVTHAEQNWAALGHPLGAVLAVLAIRHRHPLSGGARSGKAWMLLTVSTAAVLTVIVHAHALRPFLPLPATRDPVSRLHGWRDLRALGGHLSGVDAVVCDNYGLAAQIAWQLREHRPTPRITGADREPQPPEGDWLLLDERADWGRASLAVTCERIEALSPVECRREDGVVVRTIMVSKGFGCTRASVRY